jgi:hypothetical protein
MSSVAARISPNSSRCLHIERRFAQAIQQLSRVLVDCNRAVKGCVHADAVGERRGNPITGLVSCTHTRFAVAPPTVFARDQTPALCFRKMPARTSRTQSANTRPRADIVCRGSDRTAGSTNLRANGTRVARRSQTRPTPAHPSTTGICSPLPLFPHDSDPPTS